MPMNTVAEPGEPPLKSLRREINFTLSTPESTGIAQRRELKLEVMNDLTELIRALAEVLPAGARHRVEWVLADANQHRGWPGIWRRLEREGAIWRSDPVRVVFVGPSGSGKRTLIRHLFGSQ